MKFRPCIDIHNGKVKQIVGGSLADTNNTASENFVSEFNAEYYAELYKKYNLSGGHIILLNAHDSEYYDADVKQAETALSNFRGGLQIGGGINPDNAKVFLDMGASHVIVTSYVFSGGVINYDRLEKMVDTVGKERLVLDLSCRKKDGKYYIVTDRWQKFTDTVLDLNIIEKLSKYCDEFLVHAVDVEGKANGIEGDVAALLGKECSAPVTYAGGISSYDDLELLKRLGRGKVDFTVGSALDLFGGKLKFEDIVAFGE